MNHLPPESCGSTFYHAKDIGFGASMISHTPQPDEPFLRGLDELETRKHDRQAEISRMREEMMVDNEA